MSTQNGNAILDLALCGLPEEIRKNLIASYLDLKSAHFKSDYEKCGLKAGWFCEALLRAVQHFLTCQHIPFGAQIPRFDEECRKLEQIPKTAGPEGIRIIVPRALNFAYTLRNKRGIGHVSGDIGANAIDAHAATTIADWCMSELIRTIHKLPIEKARGLIDSLAIRDFPYIWRIADRTRVLPQGLEYSQMALLVLHAAVGSPTTPRKLCGDLEHSNFTVFKKQVLTPLHRKGLIDFDQKRNLVSLSPTGVREVEKTIVPSIQNQLSN